MRVSPITMVIFIVLAVFGIMAAYIFHSARTAHVEELEEVQESLSRQQTALTNQLKEKTALENAVGYNLSQLVEVTGSTSDSKPARKLDDLLKSKITARDELVKEIGRQIGDVDAQGASRDLERIIADALAGTTPEELQNSQIGEVIEKLRKCEQVAAEHKKVRTEGQAKVDALNTSITAKTDETRTTLRDWDKKIEAAWEARGQERDKLITDRKTWETEIVQLEKDLEESKAVLAKVKSQKAVQEDQASPADGKVLSYDFRTRKGTVDLGAHDGVKTGYEFDVYHRHPGPDTPDRRDYLGRVSLIDVKPEISVFTVVPSEFDQAKKHIDAGDLVCNRLFDASPTKKFYIAGYFPSGSDYSHRGLAGLVKKSGGEVQKEIGLDTDYVIVGLTSAKGLTDLSEDTKKAIDKAGTDFERARRYNITVLTVDRFLTLIDRK